MYRSDLAYIHHVAFGDLAEHAAPELVRILREHGIRSGARARRPPLIVELGCGSGILARHLVAAGCRVLGIDSSPDMIRLARAHAPGARFRVASAVVTPIPRCDAVIAIGEVISYFKTWTTVDRLFRRVHAALAPGGLFIFDFIESGERRTFAPKGRAGDDWAIVARADLSPDGRALVRRMTMFRKAGREYRQSHEVHRVRIYPRAQVAAALAKAGFDARMRRSYGRYRLLPGDVAVLAAGAGPRA